MDLTEETTPFGKARPINSTTSGGFVSVVPTVTEPMEASGDGVIEMSASGGGSVMRNAFIVPYGLGDDGSGFGMRMIGWRRIGANDSILWMPWLLADVSAVLCGMTGVDGSPVSASERFVDTFSVTDPYISLPAGGQGFSSIFYSNSNDLAGWLLVPIHGFEKVQFVFNCDTGVTSANALVAFT